MAKKKTKTELTAEVATDINKIKEDKIITEATEQVETVEVETVVIEKVEPVKVIKTEIKPKNVRRVVKKVETVEVVEEVNQLTKDVMSAIAMVKPRNIVAIPLIYNKFVSLTKEKYNKQAVLALIKQLINKK